MQSDNSSTLCGQEYEGGIAADLIRDAAGSVDLTKWWVEKRHVFHEAWCVTIVRELVVKEFEREAFEKEQQIC